VATSRQGRRRVTRKATRPLSWRRSAGEKAKPVTAASMRHGLRPTAASPGAGAQLMQTSQRRRPPRSEPPDGLCMSAAIFASRRRMHSPTSLAMSGITALPSALRRCGRPGSPGSLRKTAGWHILCSNSSSKQRYQSNRLRVPGLHGFGHDGRSSKHCGSPRPLG
jgi:hypothetical protein